MTQREFFQNVISANINDEMTEMAGELISKLDAKIAKASSKKSEANDAVKATILDTLGNNSMNASEVASAIGVSTQKASAVLRLMLADGIVTREETKNGKSKVYTYSAAEDNAQ